jgi:Uncharacterized protein conserved in bacteria (DUF2059)
MKFVQSLVALGVFLAPLPAWAQTSDVISPAQLAAARPVVDKLFPLGTYKRLMGGTLSKMMDGMMGSAMDMPVADIARISGVDADRVAAMDKASMGQVMAILDPHFRERMSVGMRAMMDSMTDFMSTYEPNVRDALSRAYARKFSASQLGELRAFFNTPTGSLYASESIAMYMDPEMMGAMQSVMPDMVKKMPEFVGIMTKATESLPKARNVNDLSDAELKELSRLLGVPERELKSARP